MRPSDLPPGPLAVDTDAFSFVHLRKGDYGAFGAFMAGRLLVIPFPVVGELKVMARRANWGTARVTELDIAIGACAVVPGDARVVDCWAMLRARLFTRLKGEGINDLWIAACCLVHGLPLLTNNLSDFQTIAAEAPALTLVHPQL